ncbi:unnamed protein product [Schistocephalus solidus]|uniref:BACK domain-containing protein n=1 Tax=Schistocephalus solidus TaxID=70667 RepID=A0A183TTA5_SCHSO|nr:unnamed protein product [Schistocephalus solidus]
MAFAQSEIFEDEFPLVRSCPALNEIRLAEEIKDLTIEVGALALTRLYVHICACVATVFVNYVYTGQVELTQANVRDVVMIARIIKLPVLENWGQNFMAKRVTFENLATTWDFASSFKINLLTEKCLCLMRQRFEEFVATDLFLRMPADTVLTLLRSDDLSVGSEEQVIGAISRWAGAGDKADDEKLKVHAPAMLKEVQWHQMTFECRSRLMERYPTFQKSPECLDKVPCPFNVRPRVREERVTGVPSVCSADKKRPRRRGIKGETNSEHRVAKMPPYASAVVSRPPPPQTHFFLFGRDKDDRSRWTVLRYDPHQQMAKRVATFSVVNERIFVVGGWTSQQDRHSNRVVEFLVKEARWRERSPLAVGRRSHAAAVVKTAGVGEGRTLLGVFGGENEGGRLSSCEVYDVSRDRWFNLPDMREKRNGPAAACLPGDSRVFIFGGSNETSFLASVEFCRLEATATSARTADFWQAAAPMRTARYAQAATPFRGQIIVAGGDNWQGSLNVVEMFTPPDASSSLGQWTELTCLKQHRAYFTLLTVAGAVFALGGDDWGMHDCHPIALHSFFLIKALLHEAHLMRQKACSIC